ncbi:CD1375 family protein [Listeria monocytogenes]|nr:CD1375 family protein [Listeria monocytogenes]
MIKIYVALIEKGEKKIDDVPKKLQKQVQAILAAKAAD